MKDKGVRIDIDDAIVSLLGMREAVPEAVEKVKKELAGNQYVDVVVKAYQNRGYALDLAIAALRAYKQEPCEWCDPNGELYIIVTYATGREDLVEHAKRHEKPRYCCQCGRKLQDGPSPNPVCRAGKCPCEYADSDGLCTIQECVKPAKRADLGQCSPTQNYWKGGDR